LPDSGLSQAKSSPTREINLNGPIVRDQLYPLRSNVNATKPVQSLSLSQSDLETIEPESVNAVQLMRDGARVSFEFFLQLGRSLEPARPVNVSRTLSGETSSGFLRSTPPRANIPQAPPRMSAPDLSTYYPNPHVTNPQSMRRPSTASADVKKPSSWF